jgi:glycosyltransferase involved in cell wall biosynthesis
MIKVGYDAQAFLSSNGGAGKGLQLRNLLGPYIDRFIGFASTASNLSGRPLVQEGARRYHVWQQLSLPASLRRHHIDLFLAPYNMAPRLLPSRVRLVLVLHDLILKQGFRKTAARERWMDHYRRSQIAPSVARSDIVLTVSEHARSQILDAFPRAQVRVIPCTIPAGWFDAHPPAGREDYLLMVTSSAPHKNAAGALEAYARYALRSGSNARPLKIVGLSRESAAYARKAEALGVAGLVSFLPFVTEEELKTLYRGAIASLLPSFAEGFGIPMLESMASGTPVIAARAASLPEVGGDAAYYFNPKDIEEMAAALSTVLGDHHLRCAMASKGRAQAQRYHPDAVGQLVRGFWHAVADV